jgi:hypothetical protein
MEIRLERAYDFLDPYFDWAGNGYLDYRNDSLWRFSMTWAVCLFFVDMYIATILVDSTSLL